MRESVKGSNLLLTLAQFKFHGFNVLFDSLILYHIRFYLSVKEANYASRVKSRFDLLLAEMEKGTRVQHNAHKLCVGVLCRWA